MTQIKVKFCHIVTEFYDDKNHEIYSKFLDKFEKSLADLINHGYQIINVIAVNNCAVYTLKKDNE